MEQEVLSRSNAVEAVSQTTARRPGTTKWVAIYARVSTAKKSPKTGDTVPEDDARSFEQRLEIQIEALTALATQRGWTVVKVYQDRACGQGQVARTARPHDRRAPRAIRCYSRLAV